MKLVIVESPNKKATIKKYLGPGYEVLATAGHFRDLPKKELGVDTTTFAPTYEVSEAKAGFLSSIRKAAKEADAVFLATDADREGESIAWHLVDELRLKSAQRIRFTEITPKALTAAVAAAGPVDMDLVDAQQARRIVDRLVGYQLSPLLSPFGKGHSAGRVQSATLHLVVARELEREAHVVTPYWTLTARYANGLTAKYSPPRTDDEDDVRLHSDEEALAVIAKARGPHAVTAVETKPAERKPKAPFTTSTLQQAASVALKLKPDATMELAQALFEQGHITYHRTDSVTVSADAAAMARAWLSVHFADALPAEAPVYKSKASSQGAHECLRPTSLDAEAPDGLAGDELRLYHLIRTRFLASQCKPAQLASTVVTIASGDTLWRARGTTILFDSFLRLSAADEDATAKDEDEPRLPVVTVGQHLDVTSIDSKRQETKPPPRFTEATLVKAMEAEGIGRPSTFANTIQVLFTREYIAPTDDKYIGPAPRGRLIDSVLTTAFPSLVAADYTRRLEETLDDVADGKRPWRAELGTWYRSWEQQLKAAAPLFSAELQKRPELASQAAADAPKPTGRSCPLCAKELFLRVGKKGPFLSCSGYPTCTYAADPSAKPSALPCPTCGGAMQELAGEHGPYARCLKRDCKGLVDLRPVKVSDKPCPKCGGPTHERDGQYGPYARCANRACGGIVDLKPPATEKCPVCDGPMHDKGDFLSCASYPTCRGTWDKKALAAAKKSNRSCPVCKTRLLVAKKGPRGAFVGCSGYPLCKHIEDAKEAPSKGKRAGARR